MNKDLILICKELETLVYKNNNKKLRHYYNDAVYNSRFLFFNNVLTSKVINDSPYKNIILNFLKKADYYFPGGSALAAEFFIKKCYNSEILKEEKLDTSLKNINNILKCFIENEKSRNILLNTLKLSGPDGSISCKPSNNSDIVVIKNTNAKINVNIHESFENIYFKSVKETTKNFLVIAMDAYLEKESEIMMLVNHAHDNKLPILLFCRGVSDYFVKNIKNIILKNNIYVYPYIIKFDNNDPFIFDDICAAFDLEKVSAEAGDSFYKDLIRKSKVKNVKVSRDKIEFFERPDNVIDSINEKLSTVEDTDLKNYLIKRKNRLSPNCVEILIPKSEVTLLNDFKSFIKIYNLAAISGIIKYDNIIYPKVSFEKIKATTNSVFSSIMNISHVVRLPASNIKQ